MLPVSLPKSFSQLSIGVSRTSIRHVVNWRQWPRPQKLQLEKAKFPEGHGEQIWVYSHQLTRQVVYSNTKILESHRALRQLPFNGKKTQAQALRKDYWKPMAMIQLPKGAGAAGQSVFQKLREFRKMHELCWDDSVRRSKRPNEAIGADGQIRKTYKTLNKFERGQKLNDQYANSIADMAAVLAGAGRGNRLSVRREEMREFKKTEKPLLGRKWFDIPILRTEGGDEELEKINKKKERLLPVTVTWANDRDRKYAQYWSFNVTHKYFDDAVRLQTKYGNLGKAQKKRSDRTAKTPVPKVPKAPKAADGEKSASKDNFAYKVEKVKDDVPAEFREAAKEQAVDGDGTIRT